MQKLYALTDYKNYFGSKWRSSPYRSGFNKELLKKYFNKYGYDIEFIRFKDVRFDEKFWKGKLVIYTSSEEARTNYKSFIEDVVLSLERFGAVLLPGFDFLRANGNKVFMEILRQRLLGEDLSGNLSLFYGTFEELLQDVEDNRISYPCVIKKAEGTMSRGVFLAKNKNELLRYARKISKTFDINIEFKEILRKLKYSGYKKESSYQNKFIVQRFIPGLKNDWKILIFGDHYYILNRGIKDNDFRASGSHYNYKAGSKSGFPVHKLDEVKQIYEKLNVPHLSLDYAYDGTRGYVHEIQAVYFGTSTLEMCDDFYTMKGDKWVVEPQQFDQEEEYVWGLVHFLRNSFNV